MALSALLGSMPATSSTLAATDLADMSLEQLSSIIVTSVSRREQPLTSAAASIYVISAEDIRRSGAATLPKALRLAPNLQVARADANQYAISARGFNNTLANRMLVLIDGRIVYSPLFSGVFWEAQDVMLEDVERIEVISGPGELAQRLRENRAYAAMVLVAVTGWGQARDKARATQAGFDYHLVKPLDPQRLATILQALDRKDPASRLEVSSSGA